MKKRSKTAARIKGIIIFILVAAALCALFYFGYYQFQLPADNYAVIFTKLHGWNPDTVKPGEFRLVWEGLIPLNLSLEKFKLMPVTKHLKLAGKLPSADIYSIYLEGNPDFNYSYSFDISYIFRADSLPHLVSDKFLRPENFDSILSEFETSFSASAINFIRRKAEDDKYLSKINYNYQLIESDLMDFLSTEYSFIEFTAFSPVEIVFPDLALYLEGRDQYFKMEKFQNDIQSAAMDKTSTRLAEESAKLELLRKYGAIFEEYPSLIDYYAAHQKDGQQLIPSIELPSLSVIEDVPAVE